MLVFDQRTDFIVCFFAVMSDFAFGIHAKVCLVVGEKTYNYILDINIISLLEHKHKRKFILFQVLLFK